MVKFLFVVQSILLAIIGILFFVYPIQSLVNLTMICGISCDSCWNYINSKSFQS